ncbi:MAG: PAS domain-containing sensor histidine kinase [Candidatus Omnitrophota bacterium]
MRFLFRREHKKLKKSVEQYREIVEYANSIILRMDTNGNVTFFNNFAQKFFGYTQEEIIGKNVIGTIVPLKDTSGKDLNAMIEDIMHHSEKYINNENENILRNGKNVWIAWTNRPILDSNNRLIEVVCIGNDITKLKEAEKEILAAKEAAESANKAKSAFLANMSHELRTPLNAAIGFSEGLLDGVVGSLNEKQKEYASYILESTQYLLSLINDILDLSKVEAGKMELELSDFDLKNLLKRCLTLLTEKAKKQNITFSDDIKDEINPIAADERKIKQVIYNMLSNAIKFTPHDGKVGIEAVRINANEVRVCVWDTGIGIEKKDNSKVFAEFEQIDNEYSRKYAGTGLGMPLSKKFIELHGGKMWFESDGKDKGTRFYFTLPITQANKK